MIAVSLEMSDEPDLSLNLYPYFFRLVFYFLKVDVLKKFIFIDDVILVK